MNIETLKSKIADIEMLIARWSSDNAPSALEKELALEKIRSLYDEILHLNHTAEPQEEAEITMDILPEIDLDLGLTPDEIIETEPELEEAQEVEAVIETVEEVEVEEEPEPAAEIEEETHEAEEVETKEDEKPVAEVEPEPEVEVEPEPEPEQPSTLDTLFNIDSIPKRSRERRSVLYSLYERNTPPATTETTKEQNEDVASEPAPAPSETIVKHDEPVQQSAQTIQPTQSTIIADMITPAETIADKLAHQNEQVELVQDIVAHDGEIDLTTAFGVNDRFLIARDLFNGDTNACIDALSTLNEQESLDDCMIHIAESYNWNPHLQGSKLVMKVLERKFKERG